MGTSRGAIAGRGAEIVSFSTFRPKSSFVFDNLLDLFLHLGGQQILVGALPLSSIDTIAICHWPITWCESPYAVPMEGKLAESKRTIDIAASDADKKKDSKNDRSKSKKYPAVERAVIDEELIIRAVCEERQMVADALVPVDLEAEIECHLLENLALSFSNICKIDNLQGLTNLVKLQLDNNHIEVIEGLDHLVNLQWLDLSFNRITKIQGLSALTQLTDLSLFNNEIDSVSGLEGLSKLHVLSLGNNKIQGLDSVRQLRQLRALRLLHLKGNPVYEDGEYQATVLAFIPNLKYFDYVLVDAAQVAKARDRLLDQLVEIEESERTEVAVAAEMAKKDKEAKEAKVANLEGVRTFFDTLIREDSENARLSVLPDFEKTLGSCRIIFQRIVDEFVPVILGKQAEKEQERKLFEHALVEAKKHTEELSRQKIQEFESHRKKAFNLYLDSLANSNPEPSLLEKLQDEVTTLSDDLMELEMLLVRSSTIRAGYTFRMSGHAIS